MNSKIYERQQQYNKVYRNIKNYNPSLQDKRALAVTLSQLHKSIEHKFENSKSKDYVFPRNADLSQIDSEQQQTTMTTQIVDLHQIQDKQNKAPIHQARYQVHLYKNKNQSKSNQHSFKHDQIRQASPQLNEQKPIKLKHKFNTQEKRFKTEMFPQKQQRIKLISLIKTPKAIQFIDSSKHAKEDQTVALEQNYAGNNGFQLDFRRIANSKGQQEGKPLEIPRSNKNVGLMKQALKSLQKSCSKIKRSNKSKQSTRPFNSKVLEQFMNSKSLSKKCYQSYSHLPKNRKINMNQTTILKQNKIEENCSKQVKNKTNRNKKVAIKIFEKGGHRENARKQYGINIKNHVVKTHE